MIITIARECGAGGEVVGKLLSIFLFIVGKHCWIWQKKKDFMMKCRPFLQKIR